MRKDALPVRGERRRGALDDIGWEVIEPAAREHAGDLDDLQISDREPARREPLAATLGKQAVEALEAARNRTREKPLAFALLLVALERERRTERVVECFGRTADLVALRGLPRVIGVEARQLPDIAVDGVRLRDALAIYLEDGQLAERRRRLERGPVGALYTLISERHTADRKRDARGLPAAAVEVEIGELDGLWHGCFR